MICNGSFFTGKISSSTDSNGNQSVLNTGKMEATYNDKESSLRESSKKLNVSHSGVQFWSKSSNNRTRRGSGGGRRLSYSPDTDKRLLQWVMDRDRSGLTVSREAIQTQALALIREECPDFKASSGWVEKFLIRHKLSLPTKTNMLGKLKDLTKSMFRISLFCLYFEGLIHRMSYICEGHWFVRVKL